MKLIENLCREFLMIERLARIISWLLLGVITVLSLVPPGFRPVTSLPHSLEHIGIFLVTGAVFAVGYQIRIVQLITLAIMYCAVLEAMQTFSPGRHARLIDFVFDSAAACAGIVFGRLFSRTWRGSGRRLR